MRSFSSRKAVFKSVSVLELRLDYDSSGVLHADAKLKTEAGASLRHSLGMKLAHHLLARFDTIRYARTRAISTINKIMEASAPKNSCYHCRP